MKLRTKFNLVLLLVFGIGFIVTGYLSYSILQTNAREDILQRAGLMMGGALAMRGYTVGEIKPLLATQLEKEFLPQSVPAYSATRVFDKLRQSHPEYTYKEATLNPTNPVDRATDWEADIIQEFRNYSGDEEIVGERDTPTGRTLYLARPIRISNPGCLTCHSTPEEAPQTLLVRYGDDNGFGWQLEEVVGAQIVTVPMTVPIQQANKAFLTFMGTLAAVFVTIVFVLNLMLRSIVVTPVTRMAVIADKLSRGDMKSPEFEVKGRDEIALLGRAFNRMRRSMEKAINLLEEA